MPRDWMSVREIAEALTFSPTTIYRLRQSDPTFPPCFRPMGPRGFPRWHRREIEEWMEQFTSSSNGQSAGMGRR